MIRSWKQKNASEKWSIQTQRKQIVEALDATLFNTTFAIPIKQNSFPTDWTFLVQVAQIGEPFAWACQNVPLGRLSTLS